MTDILVPAIVTAAATLASGSLSALVTWKTAKKREQERRKKDDAGMLASFRAVTQALTQFYGLKARSAVGSLEILDHTGLCRFTRASEAVEVTTDAVFRSLPFFVQALSSATCVSEPELLSFSFSRPGIIRKSGGTGSYVEYALEITGGITKADGPLSFSIQSTWRDSILMSKEEVAAAYKDKVFHHEYFSASITFPVEDRLDVHVSFPAGYSPICHPAVFPKGSEELHHGELQRTRGGFEATANGARFMVREPLIGFQYVIYWEAPAQRKEATVDRQRA